MKTVLLALSLLHDQDPYIAQDIPGTDTCADTCDDACPGRKLIVRNPSTHRMVVAVRCSRDPRTDVEVAIPPHGQAFVSIGMSRPLAAGECVVFRFWSK